jgi:hypothetical protein
MAHRHMNVEIGTEATQFLLREYINGNIFTVYLISHDTLPLKWKYAYVLGATPVLFF